MVQLYKNIFEDITRIPTFFRIETPSTAPSVQAPVTAETLAVQGPRQVSSAPPAASSANLSIRYAVSEKLAYNTKKRIEVQLF